MIDIKFPEPGFKIKQEGDASFIFDTLRKKWLLLTDEEWVRQNFVQYLVQVLHYPATLIAQEKLIMVGEMKKRFDILVYNRGHLPWMMIECKAAHIELSNTTIEQVLVYHVRVPATYIVITNGSDTYAWQKKEGQFILIDQLPVIIDEG